MMLTLYADESGTHRGRSGKGHGASVVVLNGYIASAEYWEKFNGEWQSVLNRYLKNTKSCYFHFSEFANKRECERKESPFFGMSDEDRDDFIIDLAMIIAGGEAIPVGGQCHKEKYNQIIEIGHPFYRCCEEFFNDFNEAMNSHWPNYKGQVNFVFDQNKNEEWLVPLNETLKRYAEKDSRIGTHEFGDMRKILPIQAADMGAYTTRQAAEKFYSDNFPYVTQQPMRILDLILNRNMRNIKHPWNYSSFPFPLFKLVIELLRKDQKRQKGEWASKGIKNKVYYPLLNFPFEEYGIQRPNNF